MAKITDYPKVTQLTRDNVLLLDGEHGTKGILAGDLAKALLSLMTTKEIMNNVNIADLDAVSSVAGMDSLLVRTASGNKKIMVSDAVFAMLDPVISSTVRRTLWRGKKLGSAVTADQYNQIGAGTFRGMFLGDFWEIGGRVWRIMDFDYWWNTGDTTCTTHHLVIMPEHMLYMSSMNDTNVTTGAYVGSKMYRTNITEAKTIVNGAFTAAHILNHREIIPNAVVNGVQSAEIWTNSTVELPNEVMMYGSYIFTPSGNGTIVPSRYTVNRNQLAGMRIYPTMMNPSIENQWLRDVVSSSHFACSGGYGQAGYFLASNNAGVRVVFGLKK